MQSTRWEILQFLQRKSKATIRDLSDELGLTSTGVRQHLTLLQRDRLVSCTEERGSIGRPHYVYALTDDGQALFPRSYDLLAEWLLEEVRQTEGEERLTQLLRRMGARLAEPHLPGLEGKSQRERVDEVVRILQGMGIMAEARELDGVYNLTFFSCPYHAVASRHPEVCNMELEWAERLTGAPTRVTECWIRGADACTFVIEKVPQISGNPVVRP